MRPLEHHRITIPERLVRIVLDFPMESIAMLWPPGPSCETSKVRGALSSAGLGRCCLFREASEHAGLSELDGDQTLKPELRLLSSVGDEKGLHYH